MEIQGRTVVVTGAARGIGKALVEQFVAEQAAAVWAVDVDPAGVQTVAAEFGGIAATCDVADPAAVAELVGRVEQQSGPIDIFCSNAGVTHKGGLDLPDAEWQRQWQVNLMSHVYAARVVVPGMIERGEGYLVQTASAAGLLTEVGSAPYSVTKHAAVALAEWLQVQYRHLGVRVSCVCPMGVDTDMLNEADPVHQFLASSAVTAAEVAAAVCQGIREERFLILPHEDVELYARLKQADPDRWLRSMNRLMLKLESRAA